MVWWNLELWPDRSPLQRGTLRRPKRVPEAFWRRAVWIRNAYWGICGMGLLVWYVFLGGPMMFVGQVLFFGAVLILWLAPYAAKRQMVRRLRSHDFSLCLVCGYYLQGLPPEHTCPECGVRFDLERVRAAWRHWAQHSRLPEDAPAAESLPD